ncbi:MAG: prepilin-type N-terminal cleavage/methylation domain-containing protein [Azoarcus sp.]|jgi:prepilin-type N-terminal cleavage/methylation domain-containing protein|nr:prepilin-type N-terminal cleavage/methylation domain-containing protein [Azoarcus sp.]
MNIRARGFTLAELAIALTVLSLIIGILAAPVAARIEASQRHAADAMLDDIIDALVGFALLHGRLPCPSIEVNPAGSGYGLEQGPPCAFATPGYLPWRTLGLPVHDPWGRPRASAAAPWDGHWRYRPDRRFAEGVITLATQPVNHIQIRDHDGNPLTTADSRAIAVVYSTGPNLLDDGLNAAWSPAAPVFETGEATAAFDDRLRWIGHPFLIARLAQGGRL